jgi:hypothetical protein
MKALDALPQDGLKKKSFTYKAHKDDPNSYASVAKNVRAIIANKREERLQKAIKETEERLDFGLPTSHLGRKNRRYSKRPPPRMTPQQQPVASSSRAVPLEERDIAFVNQPTREETILRPTQQSRRGRWVGRISAAQRFQQRNRQKYNAHNNPMDDVFCSSDEYAHYDEN